MSVPNDPDQPKGRTLIQYSSERTISRFDPANLGNLPSPGDPTVTWNVRTIHELCQEELGRELAQKCLAELSTLAGSSKVDHLLSDDSLSASQKVRKNLRACLILPLILPGHLEQMHPLRLILISLNQSLVW